MICVRYLLNWRNNKKTSQTATFGTKSTTWNKQEGTSKTANSISRSTYQLLPKPEDGNLHT